MKKGLLFVYCFFGSILFAFPSFAQNNFLDFEPDDFITIPVSSADLGLTSQATWEFWVNFDNNNFDHELITQNTLYNQDGFYIKLRASDSFLGYAQSSSGTITQTQAPLPPINTWMHVAVTKDGSTVKIYYDGVLQTATNIGVHPVNLVPNPGPMRIGANSYGTIPNASRLMDEVRVWNIARDSIDIVNDMNNELTGSEPGLVAYYNFNQGTCGGNNITETTLNDLTSNNYDGSLMNFDLGAPATNNCISNWVCAGVTPCGLAGNDVMASSGNSGPVIPTMSEWGLFLFSLIVFTVALVAGYNLKKQGARN